MNKSKMTVVDMYCVTMKQKAPYEKEAGDAKIIGAFPQRDDAESFLRKTLEDSYGWGLSHYTVTPHISGCDVTSVDIVDERDGEKAWWEIVEAKLLTEDEGL